LLASWTQQVYQLFAFLLVTNNSLTSLLHCYGKNHAQQQTFYQVIHKHSFRHDICCALCCELDTLNELLPLDVVTYSTKTCPYLRSLSVRWLNALWYQSHWLPGSSAHCVKTEEGSLVVWSVRETCFGTMRSFDGSAADCRMSHSGTFSEPTARLNFFHQTGHGDHCHTKSPRNRMSSAMGDRRGGGKTDIFPHWKLELRTKISRKPEANSDHLISFLLWQFIWRYGTHTAQEPSALSWCHAVAVVSLQFTRVLYFAWPNIQGILLSLLRKNDMLANLQTFTSS